MEPDFERAVREALADVNYDMAPVLTRLSPEQRFAMIGDLGESPDPPETSGEAAGYVQKDAHTGCDGLFLTRPLVKL